MALGHTFPSLEDIFDTYFNVLRVMELTKLVASSAGSYKSEWDCRNIRKSKSLVISKKPATLENFNIVSKLDKFSCSFCYDNAHSSNNCKNTPQ